MDFVSVSTAVSLPPATAPGVDDLVSVRLRVALELCAQIAVAGGPVLLSAFADRCVPVAVEDVGDLAVGYLFSVNLAAAVGWARSDGRAGVLYLVASSEPNAFSLPTGDVYFRWPPPAEAWAYAAAELDAARGVGLGAVLVLVGPVGGVFERVVSQLGDLLEVVCVSRSFEVVARSGAVLGLGFLESALRSCAAGQ